MLLPGLFAFNVSVDNTLHVGEILALLTGARWVFIAGLELRDAVRDMRGDIDTLNDQYYDHENRIRLFEGRPPQPQRRHTDRQRRAIIAEDPSG
jgi:hypothetical protein